MKTNNVLLFSLLLANSVPVYSMNGPVYTIEESTQESDSTDTVVTIEKENKKERRKTRAKEVCCGNTCCYVFWCLGLCYCCNKK